MLAALSVPADNVRGPLYMDQVFAALHHGNHSRLPITVAFARHLGQVTLCCRFPDELRSLLEGQLYAQYPDARVEQLSDEALDPSPGSDTWRAELRMSHDILPIKRYGQFEDLQNHQAADPVTAILTALAHVGEGLTPSIEITIRPARPRRKRQAERILRRLARPFFRTRPRLAHFYLSLAVSRRRATRLLGWFVGRLARENEAHAASLETSGSRLHEREDDLQAGSEKIGRFLFEARMHFAVSGPTTAATAAGRKLHELAGAFGQFNAPRLASFHLGPIRRGRKRRSRPHLLSTEELATLWHPATLSVRAPTMTTVESREAEPPVTIPTPAAHPDLAILGEACFRGRKELCGILPDDRRRHVLIEGKTGMGKSTLLQHLLTSDIVAGRGCALLDPHGDLVTSALAAVPSRRTNDVILFDAGDTDFPLAFNVLHCPSLSPSQRPLVASGVIAAFQKVWGEAFWGPRLEHILRNALLAALEAPGSSLLSVLRLLSDGAYRSMVLTHVSDPVVRNFWQQEFRNWPARFQAEALAPVQNKLGAFVSNPLLRNIVGQARSTLDLRKILDEGKVLLCNLSKGRIGEDASSLLGSFLVTAIQLAAMSRADIPENDRRDFYLYIDEFQNFATESFATILSEARKYRLSLICAHQFLGQLDEATRDAVFGNIGTMIVFQIGPQDAEILGEQLGGTLTPQDLMALPRYQAYVRLLIDGHPSRAFSLRTLPALHVHDERRPHIIRRMSRHRYSRPAPVASRETVVALTESAGSPHG